MRPRRDFSPQSHFWVVTLALPVKKPTAMVQDMEDWGRENSVLASAFQWGRV
jgi:hypothetical protein